MIHLTQRIVENTFTVQNGYQADAKVIYGDTDSVMVKFGLSELGPVMELGKMQVY